VLFRLLSLDDDADDDDDEDDDACVHTPESAASHDLIALDTSVDVSV
jgi:hypothetical protein